LKSPVTPEAEAKESELAPERMRKHKKSKAD
jgi:hypothetical protein